MLRHPTLVLALLAAAAAAQESTPSAPSADEQAVKGFGLDTDTPSLCRLIAPLPADDATRLAVEEAIESLSDPDYEVREDAARRLLSMGPTILPLLEESRDVPDLEASDRIHQILESLSGDSYRVAVEAALRLLAARGEGAAIGPLLEFLDRTADEGLVPLAVLAVRTTLAADTLEAVVAWTAATDRSGPRRAALVQVLGECGLEGARPALAARLEDPASEVRLEAAAALMAAGEGAGAPVLLDLLGPDHPVLLRYRAEYALRRVLGPAFDYNAYAAAADRAKSLERWRRWWTEEGTTGARPERPEVVSEEGITTIVDHSGNRVIEVDREGKIVWSITDIRGPCRAEWLPGGNLLVGGGYSERLFEVNREKEEVWSVPLRTMYVDCDRLANGNTLACSYTEREVVELDREGKTVWSYASPALRSLTDADRLSNGNTILCDYAANRLVEVSPAGEVVWEVGTLAGPYAALRLANGNTLVSESSGGRVSEVDREGKIVWKYEGLVGSHHCDRLASGNTLICDSEGDRVLEVTPEGKVVWEFTDVNHPDDADRR